MSTYDAEQWLWDQARKAALEAFRIQSRDNYAAVYLYHRRGELTAAKDAPAGFELSTGQRISPGSTVDQNTRWIYEIGRRLPCLPA